MNHFNTPLHIPPHLTYLPHPHLSHPAQSGFPSTCSSVRRGSFPRQCRSLQLGSRFHRTSNTSRAGYNAGRPCSHHQQVQVTWPHSPWLLLHSRGGSAVHCQLRGAPQDTCRKHRTGVSTLCVCTCAPTAYYLMAGKVATSVMHSDSMCRICGQSTTQSIHLY